MISFGDLVITLIAFSWLILAHCCLKIGELDAKKNITNLIGLKNVILNDIKSLQAYLHYYV